MVGSMPVMSIGLSHSYESFLLFRLGIGVIGASFVITQYHTSVMFAPNVRGNRERDIGRLGQPGWRCDPDGDAAGFLRGSCGSGLGDATAWRLSMVVAGGVCLFHYRASPISCSRPTCRTETSRSCGHPENCFRRRRQAKGSFWLAARDYRVWALFFIYAACFGIELTINNIAAIYYMDYFDLGLKTAGLVAGLFGLMNIFARTLGGFISDRFVRTGGLKGRVSMAVYRPFVEGVRPAALLANASAGTGHSRHDCL